MKIQVIGFFVAIAQFLVAIALTAGLAGPATADSDDVTPTIAVAGAGEARARPDAAEVQLAAVAQAATARDAMAQVSATTERLLAMIRKQGISDVDVQTQGISLNPVFGQRQRGEEGAPPIVCYRARLGQRVVVRDLDRLANLLDGAVGAGAEGIGGVRFFVVEDEALKDAARRAAMEDARRVALVLAEAGGVVLGRVLTIEEAGAGPSPRPRGLAMASPGGRVPVAPGQIVARARVRVIYALHSGR